MASYVLAFPSFDSGTVGDQFRVAVGLAIKARETDLSYPAVGLSDYAGMTPVATSSCQPQWWPSRRIDLSSVAGGLDDSWNFHTRELSFPDNY